MRNQFLFIGYCVLAMLFFPSNGVHAQAKISLGSAVAAKGAVQDDPNTTIKLRISHFKALSKDDCEPIMTLAGKIKIIDIPESSRGGRGGRRGNPTQNLSTIVPNPSVAYKEYNIAASPVKGGMLTFDHSDLENLDEFGSRFYIQFQLEDYDRKCKNPGKDPIDVNPNPQNYKTVKLLVNLYQQTIRLVNGNQIGEVVGQVNQFFTLQGNKKSEEVAEIGELKLRVIRETAINTLQIKKN